MKIKTWLTGSRRISVGALRLYVRNCLCPIPDWMWKSPFEIWEKCFWEIELFRSLCEHNAMCFLGEMRWRTCAERGVSWFIHDLFAGFGSFLVNFVPNFSVYTKRWFSVNFFRYQAPPSNKIVNISSIDCSWCWFLMDRANPNFD